MKRPARTTAIMLACITAPPALAAEPDRQPFPDITAQLNLDNLDAARLRAADLDADGWPDLIIQPRSPDATPRPPRIFLNRPSTSKTLNPIHPITRTFTEHTLHHLPELHPADLIAFADLDNDFIPDALITRWHDAATPHTLRTSWCKGLGGATFDQPTLIPSATPATTAAIALADVDADGRTDIYLGNWYTNYGNSLEAFDNQLLLNHASEDGSPRFDLDPLTTQPITFDEQWDAAGRPTYGVMVFRDARWARPLLLDLNYGRRANSLRENIGPDLTKGLFHLYAELLQRGAINPRTFGFDDATLNQPQPELESMLARRLGDRWIDVGMITGIDGDSIRHGIYPDWLKERAATDPRFARDNEPPFRSHGNTFDAALGDIDNDGDFDLFLAEITHAWAGESSDRSRFLLYEPTLEGGFRFTTDPRLTIDRIPAPAPDGTLTDDDKRWNQGDIFAELADLNNDTRLDLILASSDYPDPPPHDERLRIFLQQPDGTFQDATAEMGIDHLGCGQFALLDFDRDGRIDIIAAQSFNRFTPELIDAAAKVNGSSTSGDAAPRIRALHNRASRHNNFLSLTLVGDPLAAPPIASDAIGAIIRITLDTDNHPSTPPITLIRQRIGTAGHAAKQHDPTIHFGLGEATRIETLEITWPAKGAPKTTLHNLTPGHHTITYK